MCGIAGMISRTGAPVSEADLQTMLGAISHRGPDGTGICLRGPIGLAMTRLAIIDVSGGNQPIYNEDNSIAIVCNGEIYNYLGLRRDLEKKGHRFRTHSDVEVILHLYEDEGERCFTRLNGMFGVAIADFGKGRIVLARDPFGQKPLYLWYRPEGLAFASEMKSLAALPGFQRKVSQEAVANFLTFRYIPAPLTIFEDVEKLMPGNSLTLDLNGETALRRYWQIDLNQNDRGEAGRPTNEIRERLAESVERHLMSERPLGVFLSGGLDSAAVVASMHDLGHRRIHTFTVGFEGYIENEFQNAHRIAEQFGTVHTEVLLSHDAFWETLDEVVYSADEPLADLTTVPLYHLSRRARQDVVVVLSGEGSDELLAGYGGSENTRRTFDNLHLARRFAPFAGALRHLPWPSPVRDRLDAIAGTDADYLIRNPAVGSMAFVFDQPFRKAHFPSLNGHADPLQPLKDYYAERPDWHGNNLCLGGMMHWWLPDDLLHKADRMTMAHSIELRCPFLDVEFARYCAALPLDSKVQARYEEPMRKIALKRAFADALPEGIAYQRKKGFSIPVYEWLTSVYAERARKELTRRDAMGSSLLDLTTREMILNRAIAGDNQCQKQVWSLIILNKWGDRWL